MERGLGWKQPPGAVSVRITCEVGEQTATLRGARRVTEWGPGQNARGHRRLTPWAKGKELLQMSDDSGGGDTCLLTCDFYYPI